MSFFLQGIKRTDRKQSVWAQTFQSVSQVRYSSVVFNVRSNLPHYHAYSAPRCDIYSKERYAIVILPCGHKFKENSVQ